MKDSQSNLKVCFVAAGGHPLPPVALDLALEPGAQQRRQAISLHDLEALAADMAEPEADTTFVVFFPSCTEDLQRRLGQGDAPEASLLAWCTMAERILAWRRQDRERVALVPLAAAAERPEEVVSALSRYLPVAFERTETPAGPSDGQLAGEDSFLRLIAEAMQRGHPDVGPLAAELEASSLPVGPAAPADRYGDDLDLLFRQAVEDRTAREAETAEARSVIAELRQELAERIAELEEVRSEAGTARALQDEVARLEKKAAWLRGELSEARATASRRQTRIAEADAKVSTLKVQLEEARTQIADLRASRSWRLTAPVRALSMRLKGS